MPGPNRIFRSHSVLIVLLRRTADNERVRGREGILSGRARRGRRQSAGYCRKLCVLSAPVPPECRYLFWIYNSSVLTGLIQ